MKTEREGKKLAIHSIPITADYVVNYIYRLVRPYNIGLNVYSNIEYLGVVRITNGSTQAYKDGEYTPEVFVKNLFRGIRLILAS